MQMPTDNSFTILDLESIYRKVKYYFVYGFPLDDNILIKKLKWYSEDKIPQFEKNRLQSPTEQEFAKMEKFLSVINSHDFYVKADKELQGSFGKRHYIEKKTYEIGQEFWQNYLYTLYDRGIDRKYGEVIAVERKKLRAMKWLCNKLINSNLGYLGSLVRKLSEIPDQQCNAEKVDREAAIEEGSLRAAYKEMKTLSVLEEDSNGRLRVYKKSEVDHLCEFISSRTQIISVISFLDKFVPLSVLGYLLRQRIMKEDRKLEPLPIIIRGLSPFVGLRYENIYRSVKAASEKVSIKIGDKKIYEPEIGVSGQSFIARNEDIYISESKERQLKAEDEGSIYQIEVYFFWNSDTEYIEKRICECWIPIKTLYKKEIELDYESPYYTNTKKRKWNVQKATYHIPVSEWAEFERWCDSFGDFAVRLYKTELPALPLIELDKKSLGRKVIKDWKLLSRYNSLAADSQLKTYPTKAEWGWLAFVLEKFPNFAKIFLSDDDYVELKRMVKELVDGDNIFFKDGDQGICFCYLPGRHKDLMQQLMNLTEEFLEMINYEDRSLVEYLYHIHEMVSKGKLPDFAEQDEMLEESEEKILYLKESEDGEVWEYEEEDIPFFRNRPEVKRSGKWYMEIGILAAVSAVLAFMTGYQLYAAYEFGWNAERGKIIVILAAGFIGNLLYLLKKIKIRSTPEKFTTILTEEESIDKIK